LLLSNHYRTQLNFTFAGLDGARAALNRIGDVINRLREIKNEGPLTLAMPKDKFKAALADDLNISVALAVLFDWVRELNGLADENKLSGKDAAAALKQFEDWDRVLGVLPLKKEEVPGHLLVLLQQREAARREKNWKLSDQFRDEILMSGYVIEDTPTGGRLKKK